MKHYLLSVYQPAGEPPPSDVLRQLEHNLDTLNQELKAAGAWVFAAGLEPPSTASVIRTGAGGVRLTDGPFTESKEFLGGFAIIRAPDMDTALHWGRKFVEVVKLPIEVRPFQDEAHPTEPSASATS